MKRFFALCVLFHLCLPVFSQTNTLTTNTNRPSYIQDISSQNRQLRSSYGSFLLRGVITMAVFIGILYALYAFIKKRSNQTLGESSTIRVLALSQITPGKYVCVVDIADSVYIIGIGDSSVSVISEITEEEKKAYMREKAQTHPVNTQTNFFDSLNGILRQMKMPIQKADSSKATETIKERIRKINENK